ncbi:MAG: thioredoxin-disulfide reductase [Nitrospinota bacterium]|nr:thioredoxin-disulfide reductase [Nitrospinota bacterium]
METYDLIIIGGGPGGITAAIYGLRSRMKLVMVEKAGIGGQIALSDIIENYPGFPSLSGMELMGKFEEHAKANGLEVKYGTVKSIKKENDLFSIALGEETLSAKSVIIATGAEPSKLGVPGETEFIGKGVSTCATCDGPFYRGKEVAVVGGGDTAVKESIYLSKLASKVHIIHRRDQFRAEKVLQERLGEKKNIEYHFFSRLTEVKGDKSGVTGVEIESVKDGAKKELKLDGVFMFVGIIPSTSFVECEKDAAGFIKTDENMMTSQKGLFAIGDCRITPLRQVATAVGDGAIAAMKAEEYVSEMEGRLYAGKK